MSTIVRFLLTYIKRPYIKVRNGFNTYVIKFRRKFYRLEYFVISFLINFHVKFNLFIGFYLT